MNPCTRCRIPMMTEHAWEKLTLEERAQRRADGVNCHRGLGLCVPCYMRRRVRPVRTTRPVATVAEDWTELANPHRTQKDNVRHLAPRLGMTETALERAVLRAKKLGLVAA